MVSTADSWSEDGPDDDAVEFKRISPGGIVRAWMRRKKRGTQLCVTASGRVSRGMNGSARPPEKAAMSAVGGAGFGEDGSVPRRMAQHARLAGIAVQAMEGGRTCEVACRHAAVGMLASGDSNMKWMGWTGRICAMV